MSSSGLELTAHSAGTSPFPRDCHMVSVLSLWAGRRQSKRVSQSLLLFQRSFFLEILLIYWRPYADLLHVFYLPELYYPNPR